MREILSRGLAQMGLSPTGRQLEQLEEYARLLLKQNEVMNLTAITEPGQVARLHFLDSASILTCGEPLGTLIRPGDAGAPSPCEGEGKGQGPGANPYKETAAPEGTLIRPGNTGAPSPCEGEGKGQGTTWLAGKTVIDVGTGAGFPGVVLKILEPELDLTLVDSLGKRVAWLESVCEALSLDGVRCFHARAEELALEPGFRDGFDAAVSRAVASYPLLCELCLPYVKPGGVFLAMKSVESAEEVQAGENAVKRLGGKASGHWDYTIPGTEVTHRIVGVKKISPTPKGLPRSWGKIKKSPL